MSCQSRSFDGDIAISSLLLPLISICLLTIVTRHSALVRCVGAFIDFSYPHEGGSGAP